MRLNVGEGCKRLAPQLGGGKETVSAGAWVRQHLFAQRCTGTLAQPRQREREFFIDNLLVRIHFIIVIIRWTGLAPWEFEFPFPHIHHVNLRIASEAERGRARETGILLPNNQRQHRTSHAPKDVLLLRICASYCAPCQLLLRDFPGWIRSPPPTGRATPPSSVRVNLGSS